MSARAVFFMMPSTISGGFFNTNSNVYQQWIQSKCKTFLFEDKQHTFCYHAFQRGAQGQQRQVLWMRFRSRRATYRSCCFTSLRAQPRGLRWLYDFYPILARSSIKCSETVSRRSDFRCHHESIISSLRAQELHFTLFDSMLPVIGFWSMYLLQTLAILPHSAVENRVSDNDEGGGGGGWKFQA